MTKKKRVIKKKRYKLNVKAFICFLLIIALICFAGYKVVNMHIKNIYITGTQYISDNEIIEIANLKDYPIIWKINKSKIKNNIKKIELVNDVEVKINYLGSITIKIDEADILYYDSLNNKTVLSNGKLLTTIII